MIRARTLADQVYDHLLRGISSGELSPSTPLRELELVAVLGVSRTPIREALARLAEYGLVEVLSNRTTYVRRLSKRAVVQIYAVRQVLERLAVRLACPRLTAEDLRRLEALVPEPTRRRTEAFVNACYEFDIELHRTIASASDNPILAAEIRKLHDLIQLVHKPVADRGQRLNRELEQHKKILDCLKARDRAGCARALVEHLRAACRYMQRLMPDDEEQAGKATKTGAATETGG
jgi:DNA-binding GntR family transcriptional regulator